MPYRQDMILRQSSIMILLWYVPQQKRSTVPSIRGWLSGLVKERKRVCEVGPIGDRTRWVRVKGSGEESAC